MEYILIHSAYDPDNSFPSWKPVHFMDAMTDVPKKPKCRFRRGDVFCVISADHVSDVVGNLKAIYVAVSSKSIVDVGTKPYHPISTYNWYQIYDAFTLGGIFSFNANYLTGRSVVVLAHLWLDHIGKTFEFEEAFILDALGEIDRWLQKKVERGISVVDLHESSAKLANKDYVSAGASHIRIAILCVMNMIKYPRGGASKDRSDIQTIANEIQQAYYGRFGKSETISRMDEFRSLTTRLIPMQEIMLASAESRLIDI